eukprot:150183-Chlamydomonas_euryale.AAC.1
MYDLANGNHVSNHPFADMREIMESWRLRQPNEWESPLHWQDLLLWRNQIHNVVINAFSNAEYVGPQVRVRPSGCKL